MDKLPNIQQLEALNKSKAKRSLITESKETKVYESNDYDGLAKYLDSLGDTIYLEVNVDDGMGEEEIQVVKLEKSKIGSWMDFLKRSTPSDMFHLEADGAAEEVDEVPSGADSVEGYWNVMSGDFVLGEDGKEIELEGIFA